MSQLVAGLKSNPRLQWLSLFLLVNIIAGVLIAVDGNLRGVFGNYPLENAAMLYLALSLVCLSYILFLGPLFNTFSRIKIKSLGAVQGWNDGSTGEALGIILVLLQCAYLVYSLAFDINVAGNMNKDASAPLSFIWILVPVDPLFIIYYGAYRDSRFFKVNLLVYLVSNLARGWTGVILLVLFCEWCRRVRAGKLNFRFAFILTCLTIALYPFTQIAKWFVRSGGSVTNLSSAAGSANSMLEGVDYFELLGTGLSHLLNRLEITSIVTQIMQYRTLLQSEFASGGFDPFWAEGPHGIIFYKLFYDSRPYSINVALTSLFNFSWEFAVGDWNINIGYVGWFFITPWLAPLYILYTVALAWLSFYLVKKIGPSNSMLDVLWFSWAAYLLAPWFAAFVSFIYALLCFIAIKFVIIGVLKMASASVRLKHA